MSDFLRKGLSPKHILTTREREVLRLIADEYSNKEIAIRLGITPKTVEFHRSRIYKKLGVSSVVGAVRFAIRKGYIDA